MQLDFVENFGSGPCPPTSDCFEKDSCVKKVIFQPLSCDETIPKSSFKTDSSHDLLVAERSLTASSSFENMEIGEAPDSQEMKYEPVRCLEDFAPPKRFHRRHWTSSAAGHVIASATAQRVLDADASQR